MLADDISEVLEQRPGLTAAEIATVLLTARPDAHRRQDAQAITLALFSGHERLRCDRNLPLSRRRLS